MSAWIVAAFSASAHAAHPSWGVVEETPTVSRVRCSCGVELTFRADGAREGAEDITIPDRPMGEP